MNWQGDPGSRPGGLAAVARQLARRGLATALVDAAVSSAAGLGRLGLWVSSDNPRAAALYRRCGFDETGQTQPHTYAGLQLLRMLRRL